MNRHKVRMQITTYVGMDLRMDGKYDLRYVFRTDFPTMEWRTYEYETLTFYAPYHIYIINKMVHNQQYN